MRPIDRVLCLSAGALGIAVYTAALVSGQPQALAVGMGALLFGLVLASFAGGRWRW